MLDHPIGEYIVAGVGLAYVALCLIAILVALVKPRTWQRKVLAGLVVAALASILPINGYEDYRRTKGAEAEFRLKQLKAVNLFKRRCAIAGERRRQVVDNVQGIVWMKWRSHDINFGNQFALDDPFGKDCWGEGCIRDLLRPTNVNSYVELVEKFKDGYQFVETIDPEDGVRYRYTAVIKPLEGNREEYKDNSRRTGYGSERQDAFVALIRTPIAEFTSRYGVTWDDISTREDRENWIAGGALKVIDFQSEEVIAVRAGFMVDPGVGSTAGFRKPWLFAERHSCPELVDDAGNPTRAGFTRRFVFSVLHFPKQRPQ